MKAQQVTAYQCFKCKNLFMDHDCAEHCCESSYCKRCGKQLLWPTTFCYKCGELENLDHAQEVSGYDGYVYDVFEEKYWDSIEMLVDHYSLYPERPRPEFVLCCEEDKWGGVDLASEIESSLQEHHEDAIDQVEDLEELEAFCSTWNKKQHIVTYNPDPKHKVRVDWSALKG